MDSGATTVVTILNMMKNSIEDNHKAMVKACPIRATKNGGTSPVQLRSTVQIQSYAYFLGL